jgi:hypothetical protein
MAFDESKDKVLGSWTIKGDDDSTIEVAVCQYNGGPIKVQIGPRLVEKKNGEAMRLKAGRLTMSEYAKLVALDPKIQKAATGKAKLKAVGGKK